MLKLVFLCMVYFIMMKSIECSNVNDATLEDIPFKAAVSTPKFGCAGILITENYVITAAHCVYEYESLNTTLLVYLGVLTRDPQIIPASGIVVHERFNDNKCLYDIALIKLSTMAKLSDHVRPGKLISKEENRLLEGKHAILSDWLENIDDDILNHATIKIQNEDVCKHLWGADLVQNLEFCYKFLNESEIDVKGDVIRVDNKIVSFRMNTRPPPIDTVACGVDLAVFDSIAYFLDWLSDKMNVPIEELTSGEEYGSKHDLTEIENSITKTNKNINEFTSRLQEELNDAQ